MQGYAKLRCSKIAVKIVENAAGSCRNRLILACLYFNLRSADFYNSKLRRNKKAVEQDEEQGKKNL